MSLSLFVFLVHGFSSVRFLLCLCLIPVSPVRVCCVLYVYVSPVMSLSIPCLTDVYFPVCVSLCVSLPLSLHVSLTWSFVLLLVFHPCLLSLLCLLVFAPCLAKCSRLCSMFPEGRDFFSCKATTCTKVS